MCTLFVVKALLLLSLVTAAVQTPSAVTQEAWSPNTKWVVRFDEHKCAAIREYRRGNQTLRINVQPTPMQERWSVNVEAPESVRKLQPKAEASLLIDNVVVPGAIHSLGVSTRPGYAIYSLGMDGPALQRFKQSRTLTLKSFQSTYALPMTDLQLLAQTLDVCMVDLLETWGFPKQEQAKIASLPAPVGGMLNLSADDYPKRAITQDASGSVRFRLKIGSTGRVKECRILKSSGNSELDLASCRVARRTKFEPARDRTGQPMEAPYFSVVVWRLE